MTVHDMCHQETIDIAQPPSVVYETVRQLERMGEWSPENHGGSWLKGDGTSVGDQFEGVNRVGDREWKATATVTRCDPGEAFCFGVGPADAPLITWGYLMEATDTGTSVTETWDVLELPQIMQSYSEDQLAQRKAMIQEGMQVTLQNLKATCESAA